MARATLRKVGGGGDAGNPPSMLEELRLPEDASVKLSTHDGSLVVKPARRSYSLDELLAQCDPDAPHAQAESEWIDAPAVGGEIVP